MTFLQWSASSGVSCYAPPFRISLEQIWNALVKANADRGEVIRLMDDLLDGIKRRHD
jgi:hypothetical protein